MGGDLPRPLIIAQVDYNVHYIITSYVEVALLGFPSRTVGLIGWFAQNLAKDFVEVSRIVEDPFAPVVCVG